MKPGGHDLLYRYRLSAYSTFVARRFLLIGILVSGAAVAEHEEDHRYTVRGYVLDAERRPIAGERVTIRGHGGATTGSDGGYRIVLHLHNADIGKTLHVRSRKVETNLRVSFDPGDRRSPRIHHANFIGDEFVPGELERSSIPAWVIVVAATALLGGGLLVALKSGKRRRATPTRQTAPARRGKPRRSRRKGRR